MTSLKNLRETYFPYPTMTKVNGYPTYADIQANRLEAFANLGSVPTRNGDVHGYIALGMSKATQERNGIKNYVRPADPREFDATPITTTNLLEDQKTAHAEKVAAFRETNLVEKTILNQILLAFDRNVLRPKINRLTGVIKCTIPDIYDYLFEAYGNITDITLAEKRLTTINHQYTHEDSITNTFEVIQEYADMADVHGTPETDEQLKSMAMIILLRATIFADAIITWNKRPMTTDTSWTTFQEHFIVAQSDYKRAHSTATSSSLGFTPTSPQANLTVHPDTPSEEALALSAAHAYIAELEEKTQQNNQANIVTTPTAPVPPDNPLVLALIKQVSDLTTQLNQPSSPRPTGTPQKNKKKPGPRKYCWTHGWCAHSSSECNKPKDGHVKDATAQDMKGGSTFRCPWIPNAGTSA